MDCTSAPVDNRCPPVERWETAAVSEVWSLPGYDVQSLLGFGATGEVWRAVELATGETVALKRLREGADVKALQREAALLSGLDTPYVVRLRAVVGSVLVLDHAAGGSLAALLARRGALDPGEVVTIAAPLAQALAAAHARGLVHGDVTPANVLFTADGMPLLSDLGLARLAGERLATVDGTAEYLDPAVAAGGEPDAAADVWALAAVCHHLLAGAPPHGGSSVGEVLSSAVAGERAPLGLLAPTAPRALVEVVEAGLVADPAARPDATVFAGMLRRAHAAAPVRLTGGLPTAGPVPEVRPTHVVRAAPPSLPAVARRPRPPRAVLVAAGAVLLLALAAVGGWQLGRTGGAEAAALPPVVASPAPSPDWNAVLEGLDGARAEAFAAGDLTLLQEVWVPGSPGLAADTALLQDLLGRGQTAHGLRHEVRSVAVLEVAGDSARLRVVDVLAAYEIRTAAGDVVSEAAVRGEREFVVELSRTSAGWRLVSVTPDPTI